MTRRRPRAGFTLIELLIVIVMLSIVMLATSRIVLVVQRDFVTQRATAAAEDRIQTVEETIIRVLRGARSNPYGVTGLTSINPNPLANPAWDNIRVRSDFNPADQDVADPLEDVQLRTSNDTLYVRWQAGAAEQPLAFPVRSVTFAYFLRDGTQITTAAQVSTAPADTLVKRVRYTIVVPRTVRGATTLLQRQGWVFVRNY